MLKQADARAVRQKPTVPTNRPVAGRVSVAILDWPRSWPASRIYLALAGATVLCLAPFVGKAFHVDDTLFLFSAKQIVQHLFDPYGFQVVWETTAQPMSAVTKNPPLACYYAALIGRIAGWSEVALHLGFLLPAIAVILGTYRIAARLTKWPWLAALLTLLTPGFLVSASSIMCDTLMLALWLWSAILWLEGFESRRPWLLAISSLLLAAAALTKYFGVALIPLLLVYSLIRRRRLGWWIAYFAIPCVILAGYEFWTARLYGEGLLAVAAEYASLQKQALRGSFIADALIDLSFTGGCTLPALTILPLLWSRKQIVPAVVASVLAALALVFNWLDSGGRAGSTTIMQLFEAQRPLICLQVVLCVASGLSVVALAVVDVWKRRDSSSCFLALWVLGTFFFAGFVNWTVNARSILPLIPAAAILIVRRLEQTEIVAGSWSESILYAGLAATAVVSLWVCGADTAWANAARTAAIEIRERTRNEKGTVFFVGHWGFQYYMQEFGFKPADETNSAFKVGDLVIVPQKNTSYADVDSHFRLMRAQPTLDLSTNSPLSTMDAAVGAGFYSAYWGPLPFAFGQLSPDQYVILRLVAPREPTASP